MNNLEMFNDNDWAHLHDSIFDATGQNKNQKELEEFYESLPNDIKNNAVQYGMNDTVFGNSIFKYLKFDKK